MRLRAGALVCDCAVKRLPGVAREVRLHLPDHVIDLGETLLLCIHSRPTHHGQNVRSLFNAPMLEQRDRSIDRVSHLRTLSAARRVVQARRRSAQAHRRPEEAPLPSADCGSGLGRRVGGRNQVSAGHSYGYRVDGNGRVRPKIDGAQSITRVNSRHSPGIPLSSWAPLSSNRSPAPATRSLIVWDARTSDGLARAHIRDPMLTANPPILLSITSHSPVCTPARTSIPSVSTESTIDLAFGRPFRPGQSGNPGGRPKGLSRATRELVGEDGMAFGRAVVVDRPGPDASGLRPAGSVKAPCRPWLGESSYLRCDRGRRPACPCQSGAGGGGVPGQHPSASRRFAIRYRRPVSRSGGPLGGPRTIALPAMARRTA